MASPFRLVGRPATALRVVLGKTERAYIGAGMCLQVVQDKSPVSITNSVGSSMIEGPADLTLSQLHTKLSIIESETPFRVRKSSLAAWSSPLAQGSFVEAKGAIAFAEKRGVYKLEVPAGSGVVVDPKNLVAYSGAAPNSVYFESRWDLAQTSIDYTFTKLSWGVSKLALGVGVLGRYFGKGFSWLVRFVQEFQKRRSLSAPDALQEPVTELRSRPGRKLQLSPETKKRVQAFQQVVSEFTTSARWKLFKLTHARKQRFEGPCIVILRP